MKLRKPSLHHKPVDAFEMRVCAQFRVVWRFAIRHGIRTFDEALQIWDEHKLAEKWARQN